MQQFTQNVIDVIREIPRGSVLSYGEVAARAGNPRAARQVARLLHSLSAKHKLPWHRVINSKGMISLQGESGELQKQMLMAEGVDFTNGKIVLQSPSSV